MRKGRRIALTVVGSLAISLFLAYLIPGGLELQVRPVQGGPPLLVLPLDVGERFTLQYYHSVENAPIWEEHSLDEKGRIYVEEERYVKFGAGMGHTPGYGRMVQRRRYEVIEDMHRPTGDFILRVGSAGVDHTVVWRGCRRNLSLVAPHVAAQFSGRAVSMLYSAWRRLFPHPATPR